MIEDAQAILDYLPEEYKAAQEQEYIDFLWDSFQSNYDNGKYQFAFIAYHMLFMSFVYFCVWKIKLFRPHDFNKALIGFSKEIETDIISATTPFTFSVIKERNIMRFFKLLGCDNAQIGELAKLVDARNDIAHSNGNVFYRTQQELDDKIQEILTCAEQIQGCMPQITLDIFKAFLTISCDPADREFVDDSEQIREILLRKNYFSLKDIDQFAGFDITILSGETCFLLMQTLFNIFKTSYQTV
jgi:hypothetical protein